MVVKKAAKKRIRNRKPAGTSAGSPSPAALTVAQIADTIGAAVRETVSLAKDQLRDMAVVACSQVEEALQDARIEVRKPYEDPGQKQLHRRVTIAVYDGEGTRLVNSSHDLKLEEILTLTVHGDSANFETTGPRS